jgi:hypothetical protein
MLRWIKIRPDKGSLWAADLMENDKAVKTIGSYPKVRSMIIDAQKTWGNLEYKIVSPS